MFKRLKIGIWVDNDTLDSFFKQQIDFDTIGLKLIPSENCQPETAELSDFPNIIIISLSLFNTYGNRFYQRARQLNIQSKFIVIFDDRSLSQKRLSSIPFQIDYFLQTPVISDEINEILIILKNDILSASGMSEQKLVVPEPQFFKYYRSLQRLYLLRVLHGENVPTDPDTVANEYSIDFPEQQFYCCAFKFDIPDTLPELDFSGFSPLLSKIFRFIKKRLSDHVHLISCTENDYFYIVANFASGLAGSVCEKLKEAFEFARNTIRIYPGLCITLGLSDMHTSLASLGSALTQAREATYLRLTLGVNRIIYFKAIPETEYVYSKADLSRLEKLAEQIFLKMDETAFCQMASDIFNRSALGAIETTRISLMIERVLFSPEVLPAAIDKNMNHFHQRSLHGAITNSLSMVSQKEQLVKNVRQILQYRKTFSKLHHSKPIRNAIEFIENHYATALSLERISKEVSLNPVYFSNLFKKETGETFTNYLNKYRIEKAKEALANTSATISEIAYQTGFNDPKYFSRIFRKHIGLTPLEFRSIYG